QREISTWDPKHRPCCTVEDFCIDLQGLLHSEWNKSAVLVFAKEYMKCWQGHQGENHTLEDVSKVWLTHVMALRIMRYATTLPIHVFDCLRLWKLYSCHLQTAHEYTDIKDCAVAIVESLGQDGMSSDESDHKGHWGKVMYHVLDKDWYSKQVTSWLQMLDSLHLRLWYNGKWQATAGAWPHFRMTSLNDSKGAPVKGLPVDFYSHNWYGAQNTFAREQLQAKEQSDSLAIPAQYAKYIPFLPLLLLLPMLAFTSLYGPISGYGTD
ncbi:hypothetical protein EV401DRAFT_1879746, partial [Pisolithus croceorrhizus]